MVLLAINTGFYNTKIKVANIKEMHETRALAVTDGTKTIKLAGTLYEIGEGPRDISNKATSKVSYICSKYNLLKYGDSDTQLAVALPMNLFLNKTYRSSYEQGFLGVHEGIVDGQQNMVNVTKCICYAEGAAAYLKYKNVLGDKLVAIVDIGGNTINVMIYDHGKIVKSSITTLDLGMIKLERRIKDEINIHKAWNLQDYEIRDVLENKECEDITNRLISEHISKLKNELVEKQYNIERLTFFFTGGGSNTLREKLEASFNRVIVSEDAIYDNVDGLYKVLQNVGD